MTVKSSISLSDSQHAFAASLVREGRYSSVSAVLQQGLELLQQKIEADQAEAAALRLLIEDRRGKAFVSRAEMQNRTGRMLAAKRREHGLDG
jgi:antitoxin ParD1/3/4